MYRTVIEAVLAHGEEFPDRLAIGFKKNEITYGSLCRQIRTGADLLKKEYQVKQRDKIMLSALSKPDYVVILLALQYLGAVTVPADKTALPENILDIYAFNDAAMIITDTKLPEDRVKKVSMSGLYKRICETACESEMGGNADSDIFDSSDKELSHSEHVLENQDGGYGVKRPAEIQDDDIAEILFTTGTTGRPKGTMLSYGNVYASTHNTITGVGMRQDDRILLPLPLNHSVGMRVLRSILYIGAAVIIQNGFAFPRELKMNMEAFHCTGFVCVPAVLERLYRQMGDEFVTVLKDLRYMEIGAGSLSLDMKKKMLRLFPTTKIFNTWGSTETGGAIFLDVSSCPDKLASLGKPVSGIKIRALDSEGNAVDAKGVDSAGRMALQGPMQMKGYYHLEEETAAALKDGWLITNDLVYMDEDGFVYMLGRADDIINVGGEKVSPVEVENIASEFPAFSECACIGAEDPEGILGQVPVLFYVSEDGEKPQEKDILRFLADRMEAWKLPKLFVQLDELPRNRMKKLDRKKLRSIWEETKGQSLTNPVIDAILSRQSIRKFTNHTIPRSVLEQIMKCAVQAPTANNMQTWRFTIIQNQEVIRKLKEQTARTAAEKKVKFYGFENPAAVILITNDRRNANGLADAALAAENILLSAQSLGIGSVWNNALKSICDEPEVRSLLTELGVSARHTVCAVLCLGYPAETPKRIERRQDVFTWI